MSDSLVFVYKLTYIIIIFLLRDNDVIEFCRYDIKSLESSYLSYVGLQYALTALFLPLFYF